MTLMPALYIGHGAPLLLDDPVWSGELKQIAASIPTPKAILIVSAHWEAQPIAISSTDAAAPLVYDFGGFDPKYYNMKYETPDATFLADLVDSVLPDTVNVRRTNRGLDHGAWVPLKIMYPDANIPVLQMSMPTTDPGSLIEIGKRLKTLREHGVLVIGSGFLTHGLPFLRDWSINAQAPGWSEDFDLWAKEALARGDVETLANYKVLAPGMPYAHPTTEHFTPLFVTLGASTDMNIAPEVLVEGFWMGLSKRSIKVA